MKRKGRLSPKWKAYAAGSRYNWNAVSQLHLCPHTLSSFSPFSDANKILTFISFLFSFLFFIYKNV